MTTDITELAQREKFEAWVMTQICISKSTLEGLRTADGYRNSTLSGTNYNRMWDCWKAAGAELVEALEKAQRMESYWKTQCRGITDHCEELQARIAKLESRTVKLPQRYDLTGETDGNCCLNDAEMVADNEGVYLLVRDVKDMLDAAGIKVEAE